MKRRLKQFPSKLKGGTRPRRERASLKFALWGLISGALSILAILQVAAWWGHPLLIGSFGASAVMLFGAPDSPPPSPGT